MHVHIPSLLLHAWDNPQLNLKVHELIFNHPKQLLSVSKDFVCMNHSSSCINIHSTAKCLRSLHDNEYITCMHAYVIYGNGFRFQGATCNIGIDYRLM